MKIKGKGGVIDFIWQIGAYLAFVLAIILIFVEDPLRNLSPIFTIIFYILVKTYPKEWVR